MMPTQATTNNGPYQLPQTIGSYSPTLAQTATAAYRSSDELADFLLGLTVIIRIAGGADMMNVFSKDETIQTLRTVASRLRQLDTRQQQYDMLGQVGQQPIVNQAYANSNDWQQALIKAAGKL